MPASFLCLIAEQMAAARTINPYIDEKGFVHALHIIFQGLGLTGNLSPVLEKLNKTIEILEFESPPKTRIL